MDETLFNRRNVPAQVSRGSYIPRLVGVYTLKQRPRSLKQSMMRPIVAITKLPVLAIMVYYFLNSAWVVGVNTTIGIWLNDIYGFSTRGIGKGSVP